MRRSLLWIASGLLALGASNARAATPACTLNNYAELRVIMEGLRPTIGVKVDGHEVRLIVDSGAFFNAMSLDAATRLGLPLSLAPFGFYVTGVGGRETPRVASAKTLAIGSVLMNKVDFLTTTASIFDQDVVGLLGQNFLSNDDIEYDLANGVVRLFAPAKGCGSAPRAYWSKDYAVVDLEPTTPFKPHLIGAVTINGRKMRATFDTGAGSSALTLRAANRIGITPQSQGVVAAGISGGIGKRLYDTWLAPVDSFAVGGETIQKTVLRVGDMDLDESDMLLGPDFFLSHRIYVAKDQHKIYMTYNGGPVFALGARALTVAGGTSAAGPAQAAPAAVPTASALAQGEVATPTDADGYSRRAAARAARRDFAGAVADFSKAAELEPTVARHFYDRGLARLNNRDGILAMADLGEALRLHPDYPQALMTRGALYLSLHDEARGRSDFDAALALSPPEATTRLAVAANYERAGLYEAAVGQYDRWIADHPKSGELANALNARCWTRGVWNHDLDKGLADCEAALKQQPKNSAFLDSRGLLRLRMGQFDQAIADYDATLVLQPKQAWSLYARGLTKARKGLKAEADADMAAAVALDKTVVDRAKTYGLTAPG